MALDGLLTSCAKLGSGWSKTLARTDKHIVLHNVLIMLFIYTLIYTVGGVA